MSLTVIIFFIIQRVKARAIPCPHQPVAQDGTATPGATKQLLPPDRVFIIIIITLVPNCHYIFILPQSDLRYDIFFIPYILVDASGWVVSDVSFGIMGGFGSFNIRPPHPNDPVGIDLTPTPIPAANLRIHTRRKQKKNDHRKGSIYNFATANQS